MTVNSRSSGILFAAVLMIFGVTAPRIIAQAAKITLQSKSERKIAPELGLEDSNGKRAVLKEYQGKVVLLDFWATWCHGCKQEIPWFAEFYRKYDKEGLSVVGVSLDEDGWKVVKPFIREASVPYRILLGNDSTAKAYSIGQMPDTFLIDRQGRIAAVYVGMVDRSNLDRNIKELLAQH